MDLKQWWESRGKPAICIAEYNYREDFEKSERIPKSEFREKIKEFRQAEACPTSSAKNNNNTKTILQINDVHVPFEDKKTLDAVYNFIDYLDPDEIVIAGDFQDFHEVSKFDKDPMRSFNLQDEIDAGYKILKELSSKAQVHFIEGNHEARLKKWLWKNPELASLKVLEIDKLLNLDLLGIKYHPEKYICNDFIFYHGSVVRAHSSFSAKAELEKHGTSGSSGHTHRIGSFTKTDFRGTVAWYENGCLCNLKPHYVS
jgi:predicted phosphodiesterase